MPRVEFPRPMRIDTLTIVGVGLIGGSVGLAARARGVARRVVGVGRDRGDSTRPATPAPSTDCALGPRGRCARGRPRRRSARRSIGSPRRCSRRPPTAGPGRSSPTPAAPRRTSSAPSTGRLPPGVAFVGSHPLAGSEKKGAEHARADLFEGRLTVVTPTPRDADRTRWTAVEQFWQALGARVIRMDARASTTGRWRSTSHLPHAVAAGAGRRACRPSWLALTAGGFRDTTRIAAGDPDLWAAIFRGEPRRGAGRAGPVRRPPRRVPAAAGGRRRGRAGAVAGRGEEGARCSGKLRSGRAAATASASGSATSSTCSRTPSAAATSSPRRPAATCSKATSATRDARAAGRTSCSSIRSSRPARVRAGRRRATGHSLHGAAQARRHGPGGAERPRRGAATSGCRSTAVRTFRRYFGPPDISVARPRRAVPQGARQRRHRAGRRRPAARRPPRRRLAVHVQARHRADPRSSTTTGLLKLSKDGQLALTLDEMQAIQAHFRELGREPTDVRAGDDRADLVRALLAQDAQGHASTSRRPADALREPAQGDDLRRDAGDPHAARGRTTGASASSRTTPASSSSTTSYHVCFKVETHNHPSAIEPYGGANTGLGGVIRDLLGTGLGAKPVCNTDVFCFAPPDYAAGAAAAGRAAPAAGDAGRRRRRARLRQPHGHPDRQRGGRASTSATSPTRSSSAAPSA